MCLTDLCLGAATIQYSNTEFTNNGDENVMDKIFSKTLEEILLSEPHKAGMRELTYRCIFTSKMSSVHPPGKYLL